MDNKQLDAISLRIIQVWVFILIAIISIGALSWLAETVWRLFLCPLAVKWRMTH